MAASNTELALIGQFGPSKSYPFVSGSYTLIGPLPRGWYTIVELDADTKISPQGDATIATQMDGDDSVATTYDAGAVDRFCVNYDPTDPVDTKPPDDRYLAVRRTTAGVASIRLRVMRAGVTLP